MTVAFFVCQDIPLFGGFSNLFLLSLERLKAKAISPYTPLLVVETGSTVALQLHISVPERQWDVSSFAPLTIIIGYFLLLWQCDCTFPLLCFVQMVINKCSYIQRWGCLIHCDSCCGCGWWPVSTPAVLRVKIASQLHAGTTWWSDPVETLTI